MNHYAPSLLSTPNGDKELYLVAEEPGGGAGVRGVRVRNRLVRADARPCPANPRSCTEGRDVNVLSESIVMSLRLAR